MKFMVWDRGKRQIIILKQSRMVLKRRLPSTPMFFIKQKFRLAYQKKKKNVLKITERYFSSDGEKSTKKVTIFIGKMIPLSILKIILQRKIKKFV